MRIVILDGYTLNPGDNPWDPVAELGSLKVFDRTPRQLVVERASGAHVVVTNKTRLGADALAELDRLGLITVLATGYDNVDVAAAVARGVTVCNVPAYATNSVAQHVFALLLELSNRVGEHDRAVHVGQWARAGDFTFWTHAPVELAGRVMGLVGYGTIGRRVAEIAMAFGMSVLATTRTRPPAPTRVEIVDLEKLFTRSDVISLHCPLTAETEGIVGASLLERAKPGAFLINTARGRLVDETALAHALEHGMLAGAAVDVAAREPIADESPLLSARNCIITPHMAWASLAARRRLMLATAENIRSWSEGRPVNVVA